MSEDLSGFSMMDLFRMEADERLAVLSKGLVELEDGAPSATIEPLMRAAHSLKGAARVVGLDAAVQVAHAMEDVLVAAQKGKIALPPPSIDVLLRGVDFLTDIAQVAEADQEAWRAEHADEIEALLADLASAEAGNPPENPAPALAPDSSPAPAEPPPSPAPEPDANGNGNGNGSGAENGNGAAAAVDPEARAQAVAATLAPPAEKADRVVRVTAESLSRLMGLAGESLVRARRFRPFLDSLTGLRERQARLLETLQHIGERLDAAGPGAGGGEAARDMVAKARDQAARCHQELGENLEAIEDFARGGEDISSRLHHEVLASRMRPLADGVRNFPRLVRDLAKQMGKQARFEAVGETTGVDRDILDGLDAPLNHLIRNAIDHGLESPEERAAMGKNPVGLIQLEARHRAGMLQIILRDDGRGIDIERLREKVVDRGHATRAMAARLSDTELLDFLFLPGFTTRGEVSETSGRGVGLDVVRIMVQGVRGNVRVSSKLGEGTRFILQLPLALSILRALLVEIGGEPYAFPLNRIDRIAMVDRDQLIDLEGKPHMMLDDQPVGLVEAARVLELDAPPRDSGPLPVVVASDRGHRFGVVVGAFLGERDLRIAPLDPRLGRVPNLNSSSILEDGWPALVIDVEDLVRSIDNLLGGRRLRKLSAEAAQTAEERPVKRVLVVDDSITVRELERQLLENQGYSVDVAVDGVDGWNAVRSSRYDLIVSDIDMPRMDGIELVAHIKNDPQLQAIPVIIVSYKDREEDRIRGLDAGANVYLTKSSFHDQTFLDAVVDLIGEARE